MSNIKSTSELTVNIVMDLSESEAQALIAMAGGNAKVINAVATPKDIKSKKRS